jgi:flagellar assembly protein FliH
MAALKKYMFDLDFDAELAAAPEAPPPPVDGMDETTVEEPPPPPTYSEFELEEAKRIAFAEGHDAGVKEAAEVTERSQAEALAALAAGFAQVMAEQRTAIEGLRRDAVQLAVSVVRKLQPEMARRYGTDEIAGVIRECLLQIDEAARLMVRVHPDLLDGVRVEAQRVADEAEFEGKILFAPDPKLALGDCRVEWGNGGADRDQALLWTEIDGIVARALEGMRTAAAAAPAPT